MTERAGIKGLGFYAPREDITAFELAQILDLFMRATAGASGEGLCEMWANLPESVTRHFQARRRDG